MLQIGAQGQQWRMILGHPGFLPLEGRMVGERVGQRRAVSRKWVCRSSGNRSLTCTRRSRGVLAAMDRSAVEPWATELDTGGSELDERRVKWKSRFNTAVNKLSKWMVSILATGAVLWMHDEHALWFAIGAVLNGLFCKCLKYLIDENRPLTADGVKEDPGMPSSHAQGFSYLGTYASLALLTWQGRSIWSLLCVLGMLLSLTYMIWLRVAEGLHSVPQVVVGSSVGSSVGALWLFFWTAGVEAAVNSSPTAKIFFYMSFVASCIAGLFISVREWQFGEP